MIERMIMSLIDWVKTVYDVLFHPVSPEGHHPSPNRRRFCNEILRYYEENPTADTDMLAALDFLKYYGYAVLIPLRFIEEYDWRRLRAGKDDDGFPYVMLPSGKRLYMPKHLSMRQAKIGVNHLLTEQDGRSPHCYLTETFNVDENDVLADVGCAEGYLALDVVERVKHIYLFESEPEWIQALNRTFEPWKEKVTIVQTFVTDHDGDGCVSLDSVFELEGVRPTFVKLDVEGGEMDVFRGMHGLLESRTPMKIAACTYHLPEAHGEISAFLESHRFVYETSRGVMFSRIGGVKPPYFRKGLVRAVRR